ncbi:CheR family methyltransferase [Arcobacter sp.]|uniref:CheR family methyltransferase n=1 Tax=Arcobacter sp. TaxID=1872629 RepID=UPI003D0C6218
MHANNGIFYKIPLKDIEFEKIKSLIYDKSGIFLKAEKKTLIENRLSKHIKTIGCKTFNEYHNYISSNIDEIQIMIDLITTNETYFFREIEHFKFFEKEIIPKQKSHLRVWSAASSIGAEAYSLAMILESSNEIKKYGYSVVGTDINTEVLKRAENGLYPMKFSEKIPRQYLREYCLEGFGKYEGSFMINDTLKSKTQFRQVNLIEPIPSFIEPFDIVFLRNVLIYFDMPMKQKIIKNIIPKIKKGGYLFIGHSESLNNISNALKQVRPTVYIKEF